MKRSHFMRYQIWNCSMDNRIEASVNCSERNKVYAHFHLFPVRLITNIKSFSHEEYKKQHYTVYSK